MLGLAAIFSARDEMKRKGGTMQSPGYPRTDTDAKKLLETGIALGASWSLDDVPGISISVSADKDVIYRLVEQQREATGRPPIPDWPSE